MFALSEESSVELDAEVSPLGDLVTAFGPTRLVFTGVTGTTQISLQATVDSDSPTVSITGSALLDTDMRHRGEVRRSAKEKRIRKLSNLYFPIDPLPFGCEGFGSCCLFR